MDGKTYETEILDITAEHLGYTGEVLNRTDKLKRNIDLLEVAVKNNSEALILENCLEVYSKLPNFHIVKYKK